ncbi:uncharacterized protein LOC123450518 [Hordeum vulgare subsp. vulgare]|uniref:uncharacterized protein LOC123450518 n=1 Tax=Hordeum vulgare subsp. vulgare TaxID=112509 RepID=UPI001D1A4FEC|nr:uncharacterized protein LOC123450518 [Hordeum vulgare subsp. vulgare]
MDRPPAQPCYSVNTRGLRNIPNRGPTPGPSHDARTPTTSPTHLLLPHGAHPLHNLPLTRSRCHALAGDGSHPLCFTLVLPWARTAIPCVPPLRPRATTAALIFHNLNLAAPAPPFTTSVSRLTSVPAFHCSGLALSRHSAATFLLPTAFFFHSMAGPVSGSPRSVSDSLLRATSSPSCSKAKEHALRLFCRSVYSFCRRGNNNKKDRKLTSTRMPLL